MNKILQLLFALLLFAFHPPAFAGLNDGLVAYWSFDNCSAKDDSGNGHDGVINGSPQCVDGSKGKAFSFNGINDHILVNDESMVFTPNNLTISIWVNPNQAQLDFAGIIDKSHALTQSGWVLQKSSYDDSAYYFAYYIPEQGWSNPYGEGQRITATQNKWSHLSIIKNANKVVTYLNGVKIQEVAYSSANVLQDTKPLLIGAVNGLNRYFNGSIDDLRIYNRALTDSEVAELYAQGTTPTNNQLGELVDIEKSSIDYSADGKINFSLKNEPTPVSVFHTPSIYRVKVSVGDEIIANIKPTTKTTSIDFFPKSQGNNQQDKLIKLDFYRAIRVKTDKWKTQEIYVGTLYGVTDPIRLTHTAYNPSILASRTLSQTKPHTGNECITANNIASECNNYFASDELPIASKNVAIQNTLTHRIVDFDKLVDSRLINNDFKIIDNKAIYDWADSDYGKLVSKEAQLDGSTVKTTGDNNRIPLLLIHGWQGSNGLRNPAQLGLWENSELHYFQHFLDYYLTSPALQKKYHLYLYHYPTYKHVTYNAFILNQLLQEIGRDYPNTDLGRVMTTAIAETPFFPLQDYKTDPQNSLTIVAHSMGGMLARSFLEEYQGLGAGMEKLNQLITLDTPHHGSTGSNPASWLNKVPKDLLTQGALDLNWDNYDGQVSNDVMNIINSDYRWVADKGNNANFDKSYCININCNLTMNPWLLSLNAQFESDYAELAKNKYILYVAWMSHELYTDAIDNGTLYNIAENFGIPVLPNGVAEPITSALLSKFDLTKTLPFNPLCKSYLPVPYRVAIGNQKQADDFNSWQFFEKTLLPVVTLPEIPLKFTACTNLESSEQLQLHSILISKENVLNYMAHPYGLPYRIFWDYDHEKMVNGAYFDNLGVWDKFINKKITVPNIDITKNDSAFYSSSLRNNYIFAASSYRGAPLNINNNQIYNPLKTEPLFLVLERDLLLPKLTVTNSTVDFGKIADIAPLSSELALSNNGIGDLMLNQSNFSLSGKDAALFKVAASCPIPMTTTQICKLTLTFTPPAKPWLGGYFSAKTAILTIKSNDRDNPVLKIALKAQLN